MRNPIPAKNSGENRKDGTVKNPNGHSIEQIDDWNDELLDREIGDQEAKASPNVRNAKCSVCRVEWVDVLNGEDTCDACRTR